MNSSDNTLFLKFCKEKCSLTRDITFSIVMGLNGLLNGIISTKGKIMDNKTWESLQSDKHPNVIYTFQSTESITKTTSGYSIKVKGNLQIAGVKKAISMQVEGNMDSTGKLHFKGKHAIVLPNYGIEPPKALMGTVVVGEEVTVSFDVTLEKN